MGRSLGRDRYLERAKMEPTAQGYVQMLERSPHRVHRRVAKELRKQLNEMSKAAIEELIKKEESAEFKKSLGL
jgi:hypothetical protein